MKRTTLIIAVLGLFLSSCGTTKGEFQNSPELEGRPPTPEEDPFFYAARPPDSAKAQTRGTIGDEQEPRDASDEPAEGSVEDVEELQRRLQRAESEALALKAENLELKDAIAARKEERSKPAAADGSAQCHACVKICPTEGNCRDDAEMICGWGTGKKKSDAMLRATSECDGALDQYRRNGPYARVEGKCPVARCL